MTSQLTVKSVDHQEDHYRVRFRDADEFDDLATPDWTTDIATSAVPGSEVRMGHDETEDWLVQSVRIPVEIVDDADDASRKALKIVTAVTEHEMYDTR